MKLSLGCFLVGSIFAGFLPAGAQTNGVQLSPQQEEQQKKVDQMVNTPFDFYGKVIDRDGKPVAGVTAHISVMGEVGKTEGQTNHDVVSGANGLFSLKNIRAFGVIVSVEKSGYQAVSSERPWPHSGRVFPTVDEPAIYRLQKK
jgi:hypothetical protein